PAALPGIRCGKPGPLRRGARICRQFREHLARRHQSRRLRPGAAQPRRGAADAAATEAAEIITDTQGLPPWWRAEVLTTMGEIRAAQGRMDDADSAFRAALILQQRLFGNTAPTAVTYLVFARVFADQKLYPESVRAFRLALEILRKDEVARSEVVVDQIAPFVTAA